MLPSRWFALLTGIWFAVLCTFGASLAMAAEAATDKRELAIGLAQEGRCGAAIPLLIAVQASSPKDGVVARLIGECEIRRQRFDLAAPSLENARELDPAGPKVDLHLAIAYFHLGDLDRSEEALARAEAAGTNEPELLLYGGLLSLSRADYESAIPTLSAASQLQDRPVEPMASFYLGRAFRNNKNREQAEAAFDRVIRDAPGTTWADEAQRAIDQLHDESEIKVWTALELGFEHDDNALLLGRGVARPSEISDQADQRGFWFVDAGALLLRTDNWNGGVALRYGGSRHADLTTFDAQAVGGTVWLDRGLPAIGSTLRIEANFDATWIDADPFLVSNRWKVLVHTPWESGAYTTTSAMVHVEDYRYDTDTSTTLKEPAVAGGMCATSSNGELCSPLGVDEEEARNQDGTGFIGTLLHREPIPFEASWLASPWIEGEYLYGYYKSEGSDYQHQRHQVELAVGAELPFQINLTVVGRYAYLPYANRSTFPDPGDTLNADTVPYILDNSNRRDQETSIHVRLERAFGEHVLVSTRWTRTRNHSTADVFDYTRDLFGLSVRVGFGN